MFLVADLVIWSLLVVVVILSEALFHRYQDNHDEEDKWRRDRGDRK